MRLLHEEVAAPFLSASDPAPFELVNPAGVSDICLVCEHAGRAVPARLGDLGISPAEMERHIAWDVGAEAIARQLSSALDAPLALQRYSRLVIDCNRPFVAPDCVPPVGDGTPVPANENLSEAERQLRYEEIHQVFHRGVSKLLDEHRESHAHTYLVTVHSFTPVLAGVRRTCDLGLLFNRDRRLADAIMASFPGETGFVVVPNQPYSVDDASDYTIPVHGEARGLPHVLLEVRSDRIVSTAGRREWSALLAQALNGAISSMREAA